MGRTIGATTQVDRRRCAFRRMRYSRDASGWPHCFRILTRRAMRRKRGNSARSTMRWLSGVMVQWLIDPERAPSGHDLAEAMRMVLESVQPTEKSGEDQG